MTRSIVGVLGVVMALFPAQVRAGYERIALKNPEACTPRDSFGPAIRTEGILFVLASASGGKAYAWMMNAIGLGGLVAVIFPKRTLRLSAYFTHENGAAVEWKDWFVPFVRAVGVLYILLAFDARSQRERAS